MKTRNRYRQYLSIEALVVLLVLGSFRLIPDRQIASVVASSLFLFSTLGILFWESKFPGFTRRASFYTLFVFLIFSIIPVMALRFLNWGVPFEELSLMGIPGTQLHQFSNYLFIALMVGFFIDSHVEQVKMLSEQSQK
jgi:hypothetical protein